MKKYLVPILMSLLVGFFASKILFSQYDDKEALTPVFSGGSRIYFIQQGVYSSLDSIKENAQDFKNYIYTIINGKYYVFIGLTKDKENAIKMQEFYKQNGYNTYVKEFKVSNSAFLKALDNYDSVLRGTDDKKTIETLTNQVLTKYKELVLNDKNQGDTP